MLELGITNLNDEFEFAKDISIHSRPCLFF
jgi:hypothetical protein